MTGEFYLLNALWLGALLCLIGYALPTVFKVLRFIIIMCLPFGVVAGWQVSCNIIRTTRQAMGDDGTANETKHKR